MFLRILPLVWRNLWRNKRRSILTTLGVAVAIFVFAALGAAIDGITFPVREVGAERLLNVREAARANALASRLPESHELRVASVPGVDAATGVYAALAVTGSDRVHIFVRGVDPEHYLEVHHVDLASGAWEAFRANRRAALVGHKLLARMKWRVGGDIEITELGLQIEIVGVIPPQGVDLENHMLVQRSYLQGARNAEGQVSFVFVSPSPDRAPAKVAAAIDEAMAQTPVPTRTGTAAAYAEAVIEDFMGFVHYLRLMGIITVLITVLGAANAIAMSVRERTREIGVLKALGFTPRSILGMFLMESTVLSVLGGAIGIGVAVLAVGNEGANLVGLMLSDSTVMTSAVLAVLIGLGGGLVPAVTASRVETIDAIRIIA